MLTGFLTDMLSNILTINLPRRHRPCQACNVADTEKINGYFHTWITIGDQAYAIVERSNGKTEFCYPDIQFTDRGKKHEQ